VTTRCGHEARTGPDPAVMLKGRVTEELHTALTANAAYYRETTGEVIDVRALVARMVEKFMDADRDFQMWRGRTSNGPGRGPAVI